MRGKDSVGDREREETSTPIRETSAVADRRETEETVGGGDKAGNQDDKGEARSGEEGEELETDTEVGSTGKERDEAHATRPVEGQETSMPTEESHRATDDDGRITPSRGEYEGGGCDSAEIVECGGSDGADGSGPFGGGGGPGGDGGSCGRGGLARSGRRS